ncbi:unnamed protein product [Closterium sp. Naga37s-1]|nr:unnamed protein product [Closterium sp. Naga37s-1]
MSSSASSHAHDVEETIKWRNVTAVAIVGCFALGVYNFAGAAHHAKHDRPAYPYLHIRNKEFPWAGEAEGSFGRRLPHSSASKPQGRFTRRSAGCGASVACHEEEGEQRGREWGESDAHHLCQGIQSSKNFCMRVRVAMHRVEKGRGWGEAGKGMGGSRERDGGKQGAGWGEAGSGMGGSREGDGGKQGRGWGEAGMGMGGSREGDGGKQGEGVRGVPALTLCLSLSGTPPPLFPPLRPSPAVSPPLPFTFCLSLSAPPPLFLPLRPSPSVSPRLPFTLCLSTCVLPPVSLPLCP